ncbi:ATP-binding protein (plasmid) [Paraburkholderia sp. FT54]|uniref:ATP-binding protein n=1 Tax=Paraburkholderia sp. FT54 TaxID=3074437 RepID=UPI002877598D|nr:ATP-binding protein [Paraburkholderia sp. FT54]WNC95174.1 ATP-binding protein [Paraburkholderia sp. FT54]
MEDTGKGLDPSIAERILEPFATTKSDGMGLGLSICRAIIEEAHGEELSVSPRSPHGTVFQFTVPVAASGDYSNLAPSSGRIAAVLSARRRRNSIANEKSGDDADVRVGPTHDRTRCVFQTALRKTHHATDIPPNGLTDDVFDGLGCHCLHFLLN